METTQPLDTKQKEINASELIEISIKSRQPVLSSNPFSTTELLTLASIKAGEGEKPKRVGVDLVCVIDVSYSMVGEKIKLVIQTFDNLMKFLNEDDRLSIVTFSDDGYRLCPLLRMTDDNKNYVLKLVHDIKVISGTNINVGMEHALSIIKYRKHINEVTGIFLLSDGLDNGG